MPKWMIIPLCLLAAEAFAQRTFEGRLTYEITYRNVPADMSGVDKMLPSRAIIVTDGTSWRMTFHSALNGDVVIIHQGDSKETIFYTNIADDRIQIPYEPEAIHASLKEVGEKVEVAGLTAKSYEYQAEEGQIMDAWLSTKYANIEGAFFTEAAGLPLWFDVNRSGFLTTYMLVDYSKEPVDQTYFTKPSNHREVSAAQFDRWLR